MKSGLKAPTESRVSVELVQKIAMATSIGANKRNMVVQQLRQEVKVETRAEEKLRKANHIIDEHFTTTVEQLDLKPEAEDKANKETADQSVRHLL